MNDDEPMEWTERPDWAQRLTTGLFAVVVVLIITMFGLYIGAGAP